MAAPPDPKRRAPSFEALDPPKVQPPPREKKPPLPKPGTLPKPATLPKPGVLAKPGVLPGTFPNAGAATASAPGRGAFVSTGTPIPRAQSGAVDSGVGQRSSAPPGTQFKSPQDAVAITYKTSAGAPRVVAKGRGAVAEQIIARAKEHGVFVHESKELVALLMQVELDDHIPPALYRAVAELLAWLYRIEAARPGGGKV